MSQLNNVCGCGLTTKSAIRNPQDDFVRMQKGRKAFFVFYLEKRGSMLQGPYRLRKNQEFSHVYKYGQSKASRYLVLYYLPNEGEVSRFGFSLSRKFGKAHVRNLYKRRLSEIVRLNMDFFKSGYDVVVIVRKPLANCNYQKVEEDFLRLAKKCGVYDGKTT